MNQDTTRRGDLDQAPEAMVETLAALLVDYIEAEDLDRAQEVAEVLVQMRPTRELYWAALGGVRRRLGRAIPALDAFRHAVEVAPENREVALMLGEQLIMTARPIEGLELILALFQMGFDESIPAKELDRVTRHAAAILDAVHRGMALRKAHAM